MLELEHLGALPELEELCCSQQWQTSSSFSDLELTGSGSATSWLGCYLLMDVEEEEYSSKLLSQEFIAAPQPVPVMVPQPAAAPATTISGYSSAASLYSGCMPYGAAYTTAPAQGDANQAMAQLLAWAAAQ
ncbi:hypothetical protein COHA_010158 [Chlorella ohadii]|uniref:Uncharacterized protein n=1 Tax=Chlorella ohadii TaxID=2649997 RepID=A0AAD5DGX8_9CHLO|nr:hypothetical protein COHA_010158 [Chlorella ohadii]